MKYIVFKRQTSGFEQQIPVVFPDELAHVEVAKAIQSIPDMKSSETLSAGEVKFRKGAVCSGHSLTLDLPSRENEDSALIDHYDIFHGFE